jgi:uncharacterized C2H2 Zn-finger protein
MNEVKCPRCEKSITADSCIIYWCDRDREHYVQCPWCGKIIRDPSVDVSEFLKSFL